MSIARITPEEVVAAYKATGIRPIANFFVDQEQEFCGCPISALMVNLDPSLMYTAHPTIEIADKARAIYGHNYVGGFTHGVDEGKPANTTLIGCRAASLDGMAAWSAVIAAGLLEDTKS